MTKKILISGFVPFDSATSNPSENWIHWMKDRSVAGREIKSVVLPVTFDDAFLRLKEQIDGFNPDLILMTGLAKNRSDLTVERIGINWIDARIPDNNGVVIRSKKIDEEGPDGLFTTVALERMMELSLSSGVPLKVSTSAGEYVCNDLLYKTLFYVKDLKIPATFIHLPGREDYNDVYQSLYKIIAHI